MTADDYDEYSWDWVVGQVIDTETLALHWVAMHPKLKLAGGCADTKEEAIVKLHASRKEYFDYLISKGREIPKPDWVRRRQLAE